MLLLFFCATLGATMPIRSFNIIYDNDAGTLQVGNELYRKPHKKAGQYNPVFKAKIKLRKGDKITKFNTKTTHRELAIKEAQKRLDQMIAMDAMGMPTSPLTFAEIARRYLLTLKRDKQCSKEKREMHERAVDTFFNPVFAKLEIGKVTSGRITKLFFDIETTPIKPSFTHNNTRKIKYPNEFYSASYINKLKQVMRAILRFANMQDLTFNIPEIQSTKVESTLKKGLTREQWDKLYEYLNESFVKELDSRTTDQTRPKYYRQAFVDYFTLVVWTGLRTSEALKLQWRDIQNQKEDDYEYCLITVAAREKLARKTGKRAFRSDIQVYDLLMERKDKVTTNKDDDYVFGHYDDRFGTLENGKRKPIARMRMTFRKALDSLGFLYTDDDIRMTPYQGRHTHALLSRNTGKPLDDIAEDLGNLTTTTERFYVGRGQGSRKGRPIKI